MRVICIDNRYSTLQIGKVYNVTESTFYCYAVEGLFGEILKRRFRPLKDLEPIPYIKKLEL